MKSIVIACLLLCAASAQAGVSIIYNNADRHDRGEGVTIGYNAPGYWVQKRFTHRDSLRDRRLHRRYHRWQHQHGHRHQHRPRRYDYDAHRGCPNRPHNHGRRHYQHQTGGHF